MTIKFSVVLVCASMQLFAAVPGDEIAVVPTGNPVAITVIAISPFMLSSTRAPKMILALGSTAS